MKAGQIFEDSSHKSLAYSQRKIQTRRGIIMMNREDRSSILLRNFGKHVSHYSVVVEGVIKLSLYK